MAALAILGVVIFISGGESDPNRPAPVASPSAAGESALDGAAGPIPDADLLGGVRCWARGRAVVNGEDCAAWLVRSEVGTYSHLASDGQRLIAASEEVVVALDPTNGRELWSWQGDAATSVAASGNRALVTEGVERIVALDAATGAEVWQAPLPQGRRVWQVASDDVLVTREGSSITVRSLEDGEVHWSRTVPTAGGEGTPVITDELVVALAENMLVAYQLETGEEMWQTNLVPAQPLLHWPGSDLVVVAEDSLVVAVVAATGVPVWSLPLAPRRQLVDIDADRIAVVLPARVDILDRQTGEAGRSLQIPMIDQVQPAASGVFFARVGASVQRWDIERGGPSWQLHTALSSEPPYLTLETPGGEEYLIAPLGEGTTLAAFGVFDGENDLAVPYDCDGARPSWALGDLTAWQGDHVHVRVDEHGPEHELWIGIPGSGHDMSFSLSAHPLEGTGTATFGHFGQQQREEQLLVQEGGRTAAGFPPHWVLAAEFTEPGCWQMTLSTEDFDDTVVLPVTPSASS